MLCLSLFALKTAQYLPVAETCFCYGVPLNKPKQLLTTTHIYPGQQGYAWVEK